MGTKADFYKLIEVGNILAEKLRSTILLDVICHTEHIEFYIQIEKIKQNFVI
jgi:hypothetical protein